MNFLVGQREETSGAGGRMQRAGAIGGSWGEGRQHLFFACLSLHSELRPCTCLEAERDTKIEPRNRQVLSTLASV